MNPLYPKVRELVFSHHRNDDKHKLIEKILGLLDLPTLKPPVYYSESVEYTPEQMEAIKKTVVIPYWVEVSSTPPSGLGEYTTDELLAEIKYRLSR